MLAKTIDATKPLRFISPPRFCAGILPEQGSAWKRLLLIYLATASRFQQDVQIIGMDGAEKRVFAVDVPFADQLHKRFLQRERALFLGHSDFLMQVLQGVAAYVL